MADAAVQVKFGADTSEVDKGSAAVSAKMKQLQDQTDAMSAQFDKFGDIVKAASDNAVSSLDSVSKVVDGLNETITKAGNVSPTSGIFGALTTLASRLGPAGLAVAAFAAAVGATAGVVHHLGEEMVALQDDAVRLGLSTENLQNLQQSFALAGSKTKDLTNDLKKVSDALRDMQYDAGEIGKFLDANNVKWKDSEGKVISVNEYLRQAATLLQRAAAEGGGPLAAKVGETLKLSDEMVKALMKGPAAFDQSIKKAKELGASIDADTISKAAQFTREWDKATTEVTLKIKAGLAGLLPWIMEWAKTAAGFLSTAFGNIFKELKATFQDITEKSLGADVDFSTRFGAAEGAGAGMDKLSAAMKKIGDSIPGVNKEVENLAGGFEDLYSTGKKFESIKFPDTKDKFDPTAMREFAAQLDKVREKYDEQKIALQTDVDTFKKTETEKVVALRAALAERESSTNEILAEELMKYGDNAKERARIELQAQKLMHEIQVEGLKQEEALLKTRARDWESSFSTITSAFNSQLRGLITGTTTWAQAMKNIALDLVIKLIETFEKLAVEKILIANLASVPAPTELLGNIIKTIGAMFGQLTAGFTAFFAPTQGPAAPAEGAAAAAAVVSSAQAATSFEVGTPYVPRTGLALIHQGEAVIPASSNPFGAGAGGFISSPSLTFAISALDGASVNSWLKRGGASMIAREVASAMNNNPRLRPSY